MIGCVVNGLNPSRPVHPIVQCYPNVYVVETLLNKAKIDCQSRKNRSPFLCLDPPDRENDESDPDEFKQSSKTHRCSVAADVRRFHMGRMLGWSR